MIPFTIDLKPGVPINEQLVYAVKRAVVSGQLKPGDRLPSVRALSQELKINPNTAQKAFARLTGEGLLEVRPGIGCTVAALPRNATEEQRNGILKEEIEHLVVEARKLRLNKEDVIRAVNEHWSRMSSR
ncbi:MAG: GntR family transcriptional regulator [Victivallales bacterium]